MATVIEREREQPVERRVVVERETDSGAGWAVALVILLAILAVAAFAYFRYFRGGNTINVSLPQVTTPAPAAQTAPAGTGGSASGGAAGAAAGSASY